MPSGIAPADRAATPRSILALAAVGVLFTAVQLLMVGTGHGPSWDEAVYASQVDPRAPAMDFQAQRARGIVALAAPVVPFTPSFAVLRTFLAVLSGALLFLAYLPWLRLGHRVAAPLAALLFGSLWIPLFYGSALIPNLHVAFGAVAAVGLLLLARDAARPVPALTGCAAVVAYVAAMRPTDSAWIVVPLAVAALGFPNGRRLPCLGALGAGAALGWLPWIVEAYARFGNPLARLREVPAATGSGLHNLVGTHLAMLDGDLSCRVCGPEVGPSELGAILWVLAAVPLAGLGLAVARRRGRLRPMLLATVVVVATAVPYLFLIEAVAVRFLLPAYALLALPVAEALAALPHLARRSAPRAVVVAGMVGLLAAHVWVQVNIVRSTVRSEGDRAAEVDRVAAALADHGVRPPCLVVQTAYDPVAYVSHCSSVVQTPLSPDQLPAAAEAALRRGESVAVVTTEPGLPRGSYLSSWRRLAVPRPGRAPWSVYLPPEAALKDAGASGRSP